MPLSDDQAHNIAQVIDLIAVKAVEAAKKLVNSDLSVKVNNYGESIVKDSAITVESPSVALVLQTSDAQLGKIFILTDNNSANIIANKMMGAESSAGEFDDTKIEPFKSAITQSLNEALKTNQQAASLGVSISGAEVLKLNSANPDGGNVEVNGLDRASYEVSISFSTDETIALYLDMSPQLLSKLNSLAGGSSRSNQQEETLGDFMGTNFAEIMDSHDPNDVDEKRNLNLLMDIRLGLIVELGRAEMHLKDILKLTKGSIIELDRLSGEPVDLFINNKLVARGEVVVIDDNFGLRITQLAGTASKEKQGGLIGVES